MDPAHRWPPQPGAGPGNTHANAEQGQSQAQRPGASFGANTPSHQTQQSPPSGPSGLPPPHGPFAPFQQPSHSLANLAGNSISHSSPRQQPLNQRPEPPQQHGPQGPGFPLPGLSQAMGQPGAAERERERARDQEREIQIKEEQDRQHRERERQQLENAPPHQTQSVPIHLHQPVAVGPRTVHGPNGLLSNPGIAAGPQPQFPLGAPSGPGNVFAGGPVQSAQQGQAQLQPGALLVPFAAGAQGGQQGMGQGQGQQPILNDALSYLDQVKVQFADHPDVYNRFLDIMKDFKSGAIDTPGVIGRVSTLFAGNPDLIQGFNTFLPPGYRIECGAGDDPNAIRVTTPMGTTVQSMPQPRPLSQQGGQDGFGGEGGGYGRPANGSYTPQPGQGPQMIFSPSGRALGPVMAQEQQRLTPMSAARQQEQQAIAHQAEQRGVTQLQNAVSAATAGAAARQAMMSPSGGSATPLPGQDVNGVGPDGQLLQPGMEKRGPVEFNHAISYVNKIKNRFSAHPDIYKQFLEILQTYQRESKPIQDVYSQVTHLFKTAPDLLEDFKQFLPESAAQAKAAALARQNAEEATMLSNVRGEGAYASPMMQRDPHGTPSREHRLPPVGNFAPTPVAKDNKRKRGDRQGTVDGIAGPSGGKPFGQTGNVGKRAKQTHAIAKQPTNDNQPPLSPDLIPALPTPLPPTSTTAATSEELGFFDRAKKAIGNKNTMNEFLKLCNLFSQDLIDRTTLIHRARSFIGGNPELLKWFQEFVGYDEKDIIIENKARMPTGRISLSNCRGLGPSYRLLPKRERLKACSGRDELCNAVLNDEWASHPTWASEDSGFIAHRKNVHEEGLHRIEEERHDYDYNIEACSRTIQLLEPIAQQLRRLSEREQQDYKLPPGIGGQSETIYKRVIMKLYGREKGAMVVEQLHSRPYSVIPVILNRLKERLETWKMAQREWEKVWREQTQKMFWKSLDHQAAAVRQNDKRQFQTKTLQNEIQVKYEEMKRANLSSPGTMSKPQMEFSFADTDVILDATHLVLTYADQALSTDYPRLITFIKDFVPLFFGLDPEAFHEQIKARFGDSPPNELADDTASVFEDATSSKPRKGNGKKGDLLRGVLDRGRTGKLGRKDREDSNASASRASTPDVASNADEEMAVDTGDEAEIKEDASKERWMAQPSGQHKGKDVNVHAPYKRDIYKLYANVQIYCFIRMFTILYERLLKLKHSEDDVRETVRIAKKPKPAIDLGIIDKLPQDFFPNTGRDANYYSQMLAMFEDNLKGDLEIGHIEETLRRFYLQTGYPMYAFEKIVTALARFAIAVLNSDGKDRSWDIVQLFRKDRLKDTTTEQEEHNYRRNAEKLSKDGDIYKFAYNQPSQLLTVAVSKKDDPTFDTTQMDDEQRWRAYMASYTTFEWTEGTDLTGVWPPMLQRSMRAAGVNPKSYSYPPSPASDDADTNQRTHSRLAAVKADEQLDIRIAVGSYFRVFHKGSQEWWVEDKQNRDEGREGVLAAVEAESHRQDTMKDSFVNINAGMKDMSKEDVEKKNESFIEIVEKGVGEPGGDGEAMDVDS